MSITPVYRAAIIGTGRIGNTYDDEVVERHDRATLQGELRHCGLYTVLPVNHAEAYLTTPGFALVAAANRGEARLRAFGERRGVRALYTDFRRLLAEEHPDVVSVCTQSPEKVEVVVAAAEAGVRAIVVEKALATSMVEADAMLAACERHGATLVVNHPNRFSPEAQQSVSDQFRSAGCDAIVCAGFMRRLKNPVLSDFAGRIVNIHPSLLPAFPGREAWKQAYEASATETGCTVHLIDAGIDTGPILAQARVPIYLGDSVDDVRRRIQAAEHELFPAVLRDFLAKLPQAG